MIVHALEKLVALLMIVVLLFVVPIFYQYQRQEDINYQMVWLEAQRTADLICELGYIEENNLSTLKSILGATGANYTITLSHFQKNFLENEELEQAEAFYEGNYNHEIYEVIASEGRYVMDLGDYFYISIENTSPTPFQQLRAFLGLPMQKSSIVTKSGGMVRAEGL